MKTVPVAPMCSSPSADQPLRPSRREKATTSFSPPGRPLEAHSSVEARPAPIPEPFDVPRISTIVSRPRGLGARVGRPRLERPVVRRAFVPGHRAGGSSRRRPRGYAAAAGRRPVRRPGFGRRRGFILRPSPGGYHRGHLHGGARASTLDGNHEGDVREARRAAPAHRPCSRL